MWNHEHLWSLNNIPNKAEIQSAALGSRRPQTDGQKAPQGSSPKIHSTGVLFFSPVLVRFLFVCPHTLASNIHLHWHHLCGTGEHQLWPPICCGDRPKHLDPRKTRRKNNSRLRDRDYSSRVSGCLFEGCVPVFDMYTCQCVCVCVYVWDYFFLSLHYEFGHSCQGHLIVHSSHSICSRW